MIDQLRRQLRLGEFRLLFTGLLLVGAALGAVGTFSERIEQAMQDRTSAMLGADALISSTRPLPNHYAELARDAGLEVAESISFMSMLISPQGSRLAGVRAVSSTYPLRGEVIVADNGNDSGSVAAPGRPEPGMVWAATQLVSDLDLITGAGVELGDASLSFRDEILLEPEGGAGMLRLAPRVLMNLNDLDQTGLITPASRARFRLLVAGTPEALAQFESAIEPALEEWEHWRVADIRRDEVRGTVGRVVSYIRLAVLLAVVLAVVSMAFAAQGLWGRQANEIALLRCLGQRHSVTLKQLSRTYLFAAVPVAGCGVLIGYLLQIVAANFTTRLTGIVLPPSSWLPVLLSIIACLVVLGTVILPLLVSIRRVPGIALLREGHTDRTLSNRLAISNIMILLALLTIFLSRDIILAAAVLAGLILAAILLWCVIRLLIYLARRFIQPRPSAYFVAIRGMCANAGRSAWIASTFGAIMFAFVLLGIIRGDILDAWHNSIPETAPNLFLINIKQPDVEPLENLLEHNGIGDIEMFEVMRGRITTINDAPPTSFELDSEEARHRISHEYNLTELAELPEENTITSGEWFNHRTGGVSVELDTAEVLGLGLGDSLTVNIAGQPYRVTVTSIRSVKWDNMKPNFYIIGAPGAFDGAPRNFISGIHVSDHRAELVNRINQQFPGITAIDLGMLLTRVRTLVDQGSSAISVVFLFTLISAILVFTSILQGQRAARRREIALLKSMGGTRRFIRTAVISEFALLGLVAGLVGSLLALLSSWLLARNLFELTLAFPWHWLGISVVGGAVLVSLTGYASIRNLLDEYPIRLLSQSGGYSASGNL
jgi:putative ABC transport system permease protein